MKQLSLEQVIGKTFNMRGVDKKELADAIRVAIKSHRLRDELFACHYAPNFDDTYFTLNLCP